MSTIQFILK